MEFFDSHAHYNDEKFDLDQEEILKTIYNSGISKIINAGYSLESSEKAIQIANSHKFIYATVGISPNDINNFKQENLSAIEKLAKNKKVVAIGEIGLDYYWNKENKQKQRKVFIEQIKIANKLDLPIVIHTREAIYDTLDILKNNICNKKGVFHCCPLNIDLIKEALKLEFYISFAGPVTFKNSKNAEEIIKNVPLEKMLIETDSPYLSPEPFRGKRNNSENIKYIAQKIAYIKNISIEQVAKETYKNAEEIFLSHLKLPKN
ncbi:MAG: TatD family hydrolase [Clostridia bacterium]|nr:TatD family hydrolase [Clostridia bacterium]